MPAATVEMNWKGQTSLLGLFSGAAVISVWPLMVVPLAEIPYPDLLKAFCFGQLLTQLPLLALSKPGPRAMFMLALLGAFIGLSYLPAFGALSWIITIAGAVVCLGAARRLAWPALLGNIWLLPIFMTLSALTVSYTYGSGYLTPLFIKRILLNCFHSDSVFHMSITSMLKTFSLPSTGLDGIPALKYHVGSHYLLSRLATLLGASSFSAYLVYYPSVFLPFFWAAVALCAEAVQRLLFPGQAKSPGWPSWLSLLFFLGLISQGFNYKLYMFDASLFISESYFTAVSFSLVFGALLASAMEARQIGPPRILILASIIVCGLLSTFCKLSIGFALCCLSGTVFWAFRKKITFVEAAAMLIFAAGNVLVAAAFAPEFFSGTYLAAFKSLAAEKFLFSTNLKGFTTGKILLYFAVHNLSLIVLFSLQALRGRSLNPRAFTYPDQLLLAVAVATTAVLQPFLLLKPLNGGGEFWFTSVRWWLMPVCMAYIANQPFTAMGMRSSKNFFIFNRQGLAAAAALMLAMIFTAKYAGYYSLGRLKNEVVSVRTAWAAQTASPANLNWLEERRRIVLALLELQKRPASEKKRALVHIPYENKAFYASFGEIWPNYAGSWPNDFLIPALSEHAALESISEKTSIAYSYPHYPQRADLAEADRGAGYLLERAKSLGFSEVLAWKNGSFVPLSAPNGGTD